MSALAEQRRGDWPKGEAYKAARAQKVIRHRNGSVTYIRPQLVTKYGVLGAKGLTAPKKLCNIFGHMGINPKTIKVQVTENKDVLELYGSFSPKSIFSINPLSDLKASFKITKTSKSYPKNPYYHEVTQITCTSLATIFGRK
jgi:hypothetical protein